MRKQKSIRWFRYTVEDAKAAQAELDEQAARAGSWRRWGCLPPPSGVRSAPPVLGGARPVEERAEKGLGCPVGLSNLCGEAGWELLEEDGGLFYFRAKEGGDPAPIQTDKGYGVELRVEKGPGRPGVEPVLSCRLLVHLDRRGGTSGSTPACGSCSCPISPWPWRPLCCCGWEWICFFVVRVLRYRAKCRRVVAEGSPSRTTAVGSQTPGDTPADRGVLIAVLVLCLLLSIGEGQTNYIDGYSAYTREQNSIAAASFEYCRYDQEEGDLWVERMDCRAGWLAEWICEDFRAAEGDENDFSGNSTGTGRRPSGRWSWGSTGPGAIPVGNEGLILRNGNQVLRIEGNQIDLTGAKTLADIRTWLAEGA